ncbi:MAG TPA: Rrf2 family transcriptional regulator [Gemmatimonadaceae bacterium]|nr:Rrf2 family transcriptional regulator [Gemmatimonadaceae bacterium]
MSSPFVLSQTVEYALRATLYIARQGTRAVRIPEIAAEVDAPPGYLSKILGQLAREGILESTRGRTGGFRLASTQRRATLGSIIAVFGEPERRRCLLGHGVCGRNPDCAVHDKWAPIAQTSSDFFAHTTLADLVSLTPHP